MAAVSVQGSAKVEIDDYIGHDVNARLSQPLLTYLRRCRPTKDGGLESGKNYTDVFHDVLMLDGKQRSIPDESKELEKVLLNLIDKGPGDKPVKGKTVSASSQFLSCLVCILT